VGSIPPAGTICIPFRFPTANISIPDPPLGSMCLHMTDVRHWNGHEHALVFVNEAAGAGRTQTAIPVARRVFEERGSRAEFLFPRTSLDLESRAQAAIASGAKRLIVMGGDGTVQALANAAFGTDAILGIIPTGGGNDFAAALGVPFDPQPACELAVCGTPRTVDLVRVTTADGRKRLYCGGGGIGLDAEAAKHALQTHRRLPGHARYLSAALRALLTYKSLSVRVEFPGSSLEPFERNALVAAVLNTPSYGAGLKLAPEASIDDGLLDLAMLEPLNATEIVAAVYSWVREREIRSDRVLRQRARAVRLSADRDCSFHGDGEILGPAPVLLEVVPGAIRVLCPERAQSNRPADPLPSSLESSGECPAKTP
jgi:diacylglycerol kinase (ATP)